MKCPKCVQENETSKVYVGACVATSLVYSPGYYDEEGNFQRNNDPNSYGTDYRCSLGHKFHISRKEGQEDKIFM